MLHHASLAARALVLGGALAIAAVAACATSTPPDLGEATTPTEPEVEAGTVDAPVQPSYTGGDPFAAQPDESEGLTNVSTDLDAVLERGALKGACDRYKAGQTDRKTMLLCGKWMFFYETFGTIGPPAALVKFLAQNFPDELGEGFSKLGLVPDPSSADKLPLGMAPTAPIDGTIDAVAFTCASCHFAQLPDKRYAVGAPNLGYDYGRHILAITLAPTVGMGLSSASDHHPDAIAKVQPVLDALSNSLTLQAKFGIALYPLRSMKQAVIPQDEEGQYAKWPKGTMDFVIAPQGIDDHVHVVGKIIGLWGLPRDAEVASSGMTNQLLGWTGDSANLEVFFRGFALFGGVKPPENAAFKPLIEFVHSLRAPENPSKPDPARVTEGAQLFREKGCITCHDGPRGSGKRAYTLAEIGTDDAIVKWLDPTQTGHACCGLEIEAAKLMGGVKSPRMIGMWALSRFLHNGSVSSLEELFCLESRTQGTKPLSSAGHAFTCDGLKDSEKRALIAYLLAH